MRKQTNTLSPSPSPKWFQSPSPSADSDSDVRKALIKTCKIPWGTPYSWGTTWGASRNFKGLYHYRLTDLSVDSNDITALVSGEQKHYFHFWGLQKPLVAFATRDFFRPHSWKQFFLLSFHRTYYITLYENVFQNPELFRTQLRASQSFS
jgi:hypothetical protein